MAKAGLEESHGAGRIWSLPAQAGFGLAAVVLLCALLSGLGTRWEWWTFRTGFTILRWAAWGGVAAAALSLIGCATAVRTGRVRRSLTLAATGTVIGILVFAVPWSYQRTARSVPHIHDITTDTMSPPAFVAILPLRTKARNPAGYSGPKVAALQRKAYPDILPLSVPLPPAAAFALCQEVAREMGWRIVAAVAAEGRLEASDRTFWFGFTDDVVVRVRPDGSGSRIDIRSKSRIGRNDVGRNADRIRGFLAEFRKQAKMG